MFLYIDPGTGSMLFTIIVGIVTAAIFAIRGLALKISLKIKGRDTQAGNDLNSGETGSFVIFSDSKRYWNIFKPVCDEFEKRGVRLDYYTMSPDDPALSEEYSFIKASFIGTGNFAFAKLNVMKADVCLSTTPGLDVYQWKRSKNVKCYVHITHDICAITAYRMFGLDFYDSVLLPNELLISELREIEHLRGIHEKEVKVVGSVYIDELKKQYDNLNNTAFASGVKRNITVLVAPSWGESCILNRFGSSFLSALKNTGFDVIVRPHPQSFTSDAKLMEELMNAFPEDEHFSWNRDNDNFEVMSKSDILISDFSGIVFDFAFTFGRPVIYADTNLDLAPYDDSWLDHQPWRLRILPEMGRELKESDFDNMKEIISSMINNHSYADRLESIKNSAWSYRGESAVRVTDYLIDKQKMLSV